MKVEVDVEVEVEEVEEEGEEEEEVKVKKTPPPMKTPPPVKTNQAADTKTEPADKPAPPADAQKDAQAKTHKAPPQQGKPKKESPKEKIISVHADVPDDLLDLSKPADVVFEVKSDGTVPPAELPVEVQQAPAPPAQAGTGNAALDAFIASLDTRLQKMEAKIDALDQAQKQKGDWF